MAKGSLIAPVDGPGRRGRDGGELARQQTHLFLLFSLKQVSPAGSQLIPRSPTPALSFSSRISVRCPSLPARR